MELTEQAPGTLPSKRRRRRWLIIAFVLLLTVGSFSYCVWALYESDRRYFAIVLLTDVLVAFVERHGRLPQSWDELKRFEPDAVGVPLFEWPDSDQIRNYVSFREKADICAAKPGERAEGVLSLNGMKTHRHLHRLEEALDRLCDSARTQ